MNLAGAQRSVARLCAALDGATPSRAKSIALTHTETVVLIIDANRDEQPSALDKSCLATALRFAEVWTDRALREVPDGQS